MPFFLGQLLALYGIIKNVVKKPSKCSGFSFGSVRFCLCLDIIVKDAVKISAGNFIGGVCVPCGHSFLSEPDNFNFESLIPFIEKLKHPETAKTERCRKDFYADWIPARRTRIGVKIKKNNNCINCRKCSENCPMKAIENGTIGKNCIRCLRCATECPENALKFKTLWFMKAYLIPGRKNETKFYL
jgi:ferredoxin